MNVYLGLRDLNGPIVERAVVFAESTDEAYDELGGLYRKEGRWSIGHLSSDLCQEIGIKRVHPCLNAADNFFVRKALDKREDELIHELGHGLEGDSELPGMRYLLEGDADECVEYRAIQRIKEKL